MFERFTERARQVVVLAQEEARLLNHNYMGSEHVLLGLMREEEGIAARALKNLNSTVTTESVRQQVVNMVGSGEERVSGHLPFTPGAKKIMELALREALSLGHSYIGTEHLLLGLVRRDNDSRAVAVLHAFEIDQDQVRNEVIRFLTEGGRNVLQKEKKVIKRDDSLHVAAEHALACAGALLNYLDEKLTEIKGRKEEE